MWLFLCAPRSWRLCVEAKQRGYGSWAPSSMSCAASWRRCTASRHGSSARPARSSWSWKPVWSSSDSRPAPASQGRSASKRPTTQHRYGLTGNACTDFCIRVNLRDIKCVHRLASLNIWRFYLKDIKIEKLQWDWNKAHFNTALCILILKLSSLSIYN